MEMEIDDIPKLHNWKCENLRYKDIENMKKILALHPQALEKPEEFFPGTFYTPLFHAARMDHDVCVEFLLNAGADTKPVCINEDLMKTAIDTGDTKVLKLLLKYGFSPNDPKSEYNPSIISTGYLDKSVLSPDAMEMLIDNGASVDDLKDFNIKLNDRYYERPSVGCIWFQQIESLKVCLLRGGVIDSTRVRKSDIHKIDPEMKDCLSLIHHSVVAPNMSDVVTHKKMLYILHQFGANLWERNRLGLTPLQVREDEDIWMQERIARNIQYRFDSDDMEPQKFNEVTEYLKELMKEPLSLLSFSRIAIMKAMGTEYHRNIYKLPTLPRKLRGYLRGCDLPEPDMY